MKLTLKGFEFQELLCVAGLERLDRMFLQQLRQADAQLHCELQAYRDQQLDALAKSHLITELAPFLEGFMAELFGIQKAVNEQKAEILAQDPIFIFKQHFVLKKARRLLRKIDTLDDYTELTIWLEKELSCKVKATDELKVAHYGVQLLSDPEQHAQQIDRLAAWCARVISLAQRPQELISWVCFSLPNKLNFENLVGVEALPDDPFARQQTDPARFRARDGFKLTDGRMSQREVLSEIHYCVYCHEQEGDFCSKGFPVKKNKPELGYKTSPLSNLLTGCPLEEKISEMHWLKKCGVNIGALATVMIDNPMCPATGHRICNDCMKACIYQKQDPVNIPEIETRVLTDILNLPWGVEIYDLLTRWNPLREQQFVAKPFNGFKILVMGLGPAGFTLAHHLLMEGFAVVGADGLKLEPIAKELLTEPVYSFSSLTESLDERVMTGFGGVAEYGITARWDKNFLKLIYISLSRRSHFQAMGSVRFGGSLTVEDAWDLGFDHVSLAVGAGLPKELVIPNSLAPGMRQANDFLMALQLTGAAKQNSLANLQIRLPAVVIGGGLTGVDAATELQAYYIVQVEKIAKRYHKLVATYGEEKVRGRFDNSDLLILDEYLAHAKQVKQEREVASKDGRSVNFIPLLRRWGGVSIVYRRSMQESPAYKRNHEELAKALEEGLYYAQGLTPSKVVLDEHGHVKALKCNWRIQSEEGEWMLSDEYQALPARTILVATGAKPNVAYEFEHKGTFLRQQFEYSRFDRVEGELKQNIQDSHVKSSAIGPFTSYNKDGRLVSFLGDTHSVFHGSVVNAIASAKRIYPHIVDLFKDEVSSKDAERRYVEFRASIDSNFRAHVVGVRAISPRLLELTVQAPLAAKQFYPGQFYRIQTYESLADQINGTSLHIEALAAIGIKKTTHDDRLSFLVEKLGASSKLVETFLPQQRISIMGPTGAKFKLPEQTTVVVIGGYLAMAQVLSMGNELVNTGSKIIFISQSDRKTHEFFSVELDKICERIITVSDDEDVIEHFCEFATQYPSLVAAVTQLQVYGDHSLLCRVQQARQHELRDLFTSPVKYLAGVFGPMQCMLKGVCAQCLQWQLDPQTGQRTKAVYACSWQTQPMEMIDMSNLGERLMQNRMQELLTDMWLTHCLNSK